MRLHYEIFRGARSSQPGVRKLAWVIPVPTVPDGYAQIDSAVFDDVAALWSRRRSDPAHSMGGAQGALGSEPLQFLPPVRVGDFQIQPLRGNGPEAVRALNDWFARNGFAGLPAQGLSYYSRNGWTYLAVQLLNSSGDLPNAGSLPALRISFRSDRIWFPMKLASPKTKTPVRLFVITDVPLADPGRALSVHSFRVSSAPLRIERSRLPDGPRRLWDQSVLQGIPAAYAYHFDAPYFRPAAHLDDVSILPSARGR